MENFNLESLLDRLKAKYAHLNDNDATAIAVYEKILASIKK